VGIAGLSDSAALNPIAAGVFTRAQTAIANELPRAFESRHATELRNNADGRHLSYTSQRLQGGDNRAHRSGSCRHRFVDGFLQPLNSFMPVIDFVHVIQQCGL
jgi:hypothetical protein